MRKCPKKTSRINQESRGLYLTKNNQKEVMSDEININVLSF